MLENSDPATVPRSDGNVSTLLLVDDDEKLLSSMSKTIKLSGNYRVETASCYEQALEKLSSKPELSLLDINLGGDDPSGVELVSEMRKRGHPGFVCMFTGLKDEQTLFDALLAGADQYLVKPLSVIDMDLDHMLAIARGEIRVSFDLDPQYHGQLLATRRLGDDVIDTLCELHNSGYLEDKLLSKKTGVPATTINKRIERAKNTLGLTNRSQLVHLLTVLSGYGARYRVVRK